MVNHLGEQLGNYRLTCLLGQGGFAEVYLAEHIHLKTQAAIKLLYGKLTAQDIQAFITEAQTIANLKHPHILRVLDFGFAQTLPFLVMDYAPGGTLRDRHTAGTPVSLPQVISYVQQVAEALAYAHANRLIHRDVKPENMLLSDDGNLLLSDFGIVTAAHSTASMKTLDNTGTVHYMSPEQIKGKPRPASDQYALAIVAYEWLCGERPFVGDTAIEIAMRQLSDTPPSLCQRVPALPTSVEQIIFRALSKDPARRFPDILAFSSALESPGQITRNRYSSIRETTRRRTFPSVRRQVLPPTVPVESMTPLPPPQTDFKAASLYEKFRKSVEKESLSSPRGRFLGTVVVCTSQGQDPKTVVNLLEEARWIKERRESADVAYIKNYSVEDDMFHAAVFRQVLPGDYMIWTDPDHPVSAYVTGGQTIVVVL